MVNALIALTVLVVVGVLFVTMIAYLVPERLLEEDGSFRYDVATVIVFLWWLSLLAFLIWATTWPARRIVSDVGKRRPQSKGE